MVEMIVIHIVAQYCFINFCCILLQNQIVIPDAFKRFIMLGPYFLMIRQI